MKRLSQTESQVFVILCVLCFQRQSFLTFILSFKAIYSAMFKAAGRSVRTHALSSTRDNIMFVVLLLCNAEVSAIRFRLVLSKFKQDGLCYYYIKMLARTRGMAYTIFFNYHMLYVSLFFYLQARCMLTSKIIYHFKSGSCSAKMCHRAYADSEC